VWIPTFRREAQLRELLGNLQAQAVPARHRVFVSDNDPRPEGDGPGLEPELLAGIHYRRNPANLTAGVNFLRAFEVCTSEWVMILGDDDRLATGSLQLIEAVLQELPSDVCAVKFDSSLFGHQRDLSCASLEDYVETLNGGERADAFNNLCLVSNWLFRREPALRHLSVAYLGYASKISHLLPCLRACRREGMRIRFSRHQPVIHGTADEGWPKAASWYEMVVSLATFSGFLEAGDRLALRRLTLHGDWRRYVVKALRIQQFFSLRQGLDGVGPWRIHWILAGLSPTYLLVVLGLAPLLLLPSACWPLRLRRWLGHPGSFERW
jgi:hypothetical protein